MSLHGDARELARLLGAALLAGACSMSDRAEPEPLASLEPAPSTAAAEAPTASASAPSATATATATARPARPTRVTKAAPVGALRRTGHACGEGGCGAGSCG